MLTVGHVSLFHLICLCRFVSLYVVWFSAQVVGDTVYNMIKLQECEVGPDERPLYPYKIIRTEV